MSGSDSKYLVQPGVNEQQPIEYEPGFGNPNYNTGHQYGAPPNQPPMYQPPYNPHSHLVNQTTIQCQPAGLQGQYNHQSPVITHQPTRIWRAGLCNCCSDCGICLCVFFCQPCHACNVASRMGENPCAACFQSGNVAMRTKFRMNHKINGSILDDVCVTLFCSPCALCQLTREMNAEGYPQATCCRSC